jgi:hypothetical protein
VHAISLYAGLGLFALCSIPTHLLLLKKDQNFKAARITVTVTAALGTAIKLFSYEGILACYVIG